MAKAKNVLRFAMTLAAAIVITLWNETAWAWGPIDRLKGAGKKAFDVYQDQSKGIKSEAHAEQFYSQTGLRDLVGRSPDATLVIVFVLIGISFILMRKWKNRGWLRLIVAYVVFAAPAGFYYEFFMSANTPNGAKTGLSIMSLAWVVFFAGLGCQWRLFSHLFIAWRKKQVLLFLRYRKITAPAAVALATRGPAAMPNAPAPAAPVALVVPPQVRPTAPVAPPAPVVCPTCNLLTQAGAPNCIHCGASIPTGQAAPAAVKIVLQAAPAAVAAIPPPTLSPPVVCPTCHKFTQAGAPNCIHCGAFMTLGQAASTTSPPPPPRCPDTSPPTPPREAEIPTTNREVNWWDL